tara:strand:+ start:267825 stop:269024 length:1200 start_codon:yes stop_codon:yes gene_type:complete
MKINIKLICIYIPLVLSTLACTEPSSQDHDHDHNHNREKSDAEHHEHEEAIFLSQKEMANLELEIGELEERNLGDFVRTNGQLEVPPQNEASVTAFIGANLSSIKVIEGDKISKNQIIAYLHHPNIIELQSEYIKAWSASTLLDKELARQEKLFEGKVNSGKEMELAKSRQISAKAELNGLKAQLQILGISEENLEKGQIQNQIPVRSPIDGYIRKVEIKTGQYVEPQTTMFEIVNIDHIHADFMVYEKDIHKVKKGQKVIFTVESLPNKELNATIYSVGKAFETNPKAVHLHAEIENKQGLLIPGMYAQGKIALTEESYFCLPEDAITEYENKFFIFLAEPKNKGMEFKALEIKIGLKDGNWLAVLNPTEKLKNSKIAISKAYDLMAELKKSEAEHSH